MKLQKCSQLRMKLDQCSTCKRTLKISRGYEPETIFWAFESDKVYPESFNEPMFCTKKCAVKSQKVQL